MALAAVKKPAAAAGTKPALAKAPIKPAAKGAAANGATKPAKAAKPAKAPKEVKPFQDGEIVIFKKYIETQEGQSLTEGEELAVVGQVTDGDKLLINVVRSSQYHRYKEDENSVTGEQLLPDEIRRTGKTVPEPFQLTVVGDMSNILKSEGGDPQAIAKNLFSKAKQAFFYLGGVLSKLYKEIDPETEKPLFCGYTDAKGKNFENSKEGFEAFVKDTFGEDSDLNGLRKAQYLMSIYEQFSALSNAQEIIKQLPSIGWTKAGMLAQYVTDENAAELVKVAEEQTVPKLTETLKTQYTTEGTTARGGAASRATIKRTTFTFKLYEDSGVAVDIIIKAAAKQLGLSDPSDVFEYIINEWASEHVTEAASKATAAKTKALNALKKQGAKVPEDHPAAKQAASA